MLQKLPNINIFDWFELFELAEEVHTIETSITYLLKILNRRDRVFIYPRGYSPNFKFSDYLFFTDWNYLGEIK